MDCLFQTREVIFVGGLPFETASTEDLNYRTQMRDALLQSIADSRFAIYHHVMRRRADVALDQPRMDSFSQRLNSHWHDRLAQKNLFVNDLYPTIIRRPMPGRDGIADRLKGWLGMDGRGKA